MQTLIETMDSYLYKALLHLSDNAVTSIEIVTHLLIDSLVSLNRMGVQVNENEMDLEKLFMLSGACKQQSQATGRDAMGLSVSVWLIFELLIFN